MKLDKQFKYAEKKGIPYVIMVGADELASNMATVKELASGKQKKISFKDLSTFLSS